MPNKRIAMRKIHEILRLRFEVGLSFRQISQCADVSTGAIQKMLKRLEASGISWPLPEGMSEPRLASMLYPDSDSRPGSLEDPDWAEIHLATDGSGLPLNIVLSPGQAHESQFAQRLLDGIGVQRQNGSMKRRGNAVLADKAYSGHALRNQLKI